MHLDGDRLRAKAMVTAIIFDGVPDVVLCQILGRGIGAVSCSVHRYCGIRSEYDIDLCRREV